MKVQIIGQVTGLPRKDVVSKFDRAEQKLLERGHEVINPVNLVPSNETWEKAMRLCLESILKVDAVCILEDWHRSSGAKIEYMVASALQLKEIRL